MSVCAFLGESVSQFYSYRYETSKVFFLWQIHIRVRSKLVRTRWIGQVSHTVPIGMFGKIVQTNSSFVVYHHIVFYSGVQVFSGISEFRIKLAFIRTTISDICMWHLTRTIEKIMRKYRKNCVFVVFDHILFYSDYSFF